MPPIRKTKRERTKTTNITFRFSKEVADKLDQISAADNRSRTGELEYLIMKRQQEIEKENK